MVLYIHTGFPEYVIKTMPLPVLVRDLTIGVIGPCAVPMFFMISGFLFFQNIQNPFCDIKTKMVKRIRTLLIPFIIAAIAFPLYFIVLEFIPGVSGLINSESYLDRMSVMSFGGILKSLFFDSGSGEPWADHLWYLRDLIIIVILSPVIYLIRKYLGYFAIPVTLLLYYLTPDLDFFYGLFWFTTGSLLLDKISSIRYRYVAIILILFLVASVYRSLNPYELRKYFKIFEIAAGLVSIWRIYDYLIFQKIDIEKHKRLLFICSFTFPLYLYHTPSIHIIIKLLPILGGGGTFGYLLSYVLSPILFVPIFVPFCAAIRKHFPRIYAVIVGGR